MKRNRRSGKLEDKPSKGPDKTIYWAHIVDDDVHRFAIRWPSRKNFILLISRENGVSGSPTPPRLAWALLSTLMKPEHRQAMLGDVLEQFQKNAARHGVRAARRIFWTDALASLLPIAWRAIKRVGIVALILEKASRLFS